MGWRLRPDVVAALALALVAAVAHWLTRARHLSTWDSVLFALAMDRYSVPDARPHPPGYPVYIALARLVEPFAGDPNTTLVALSVAFASATGALLYLLVRTWTSRPAALAGAGLFALSPVVAHNAAIASSYAGEAFFAVAVAWMAWSMHVHPTPRRAAALGALFALALGYRQSFLFYLAPLVVWSLWPGRTLGAWKAALPRLATAVVAAVAVGLAWLLPMVQLSGGWQEYLEATSLQTRLVVFAELPWNEGAGVLVDHWERLMLYLRPETTWLMPSALGLAALAWWLERRRRIARKIHSSSPDSLTSDAPQLPDEAPDLRRRPWTWLAFWLVPPLLFYLVVFNGWGTGPDGYALVLLPPIYIAFALLVDLVLVRRAALPANVRPHGLAVGCALLVLVPAAGLASGWTPILEAEVWSHDDWTEHWLALDDEFPANETAIVASYSWAHVKWFHPNHVLWSYLLIPESDLGPAWVLTMQTQLREDDRSFYAAHIRGPDNTTHPIPAGIKRVVLFDFQLAGENGGTRHVRPEITVHEATLADGWRILYFDVDAEHPTIESYFAPQGNHAWGDAPGNPGHAGGQ